MPAYGVTGPDGVATFPLELIEEAVSQAGVRERRRRLLPAVAVVVFVLGCCVFSGEGYPEVVRKLAGWLEPLAGRGGWHLPGTAALARARRRVGARPFELLFGRLAGPLAGPGTPGAFAFGRLLAALDGTMLDAAHTPANTGAFGRPPAGRTRGGFPQVRLVTLAACGTRGLMDAVFAGRRAERSSEQDLARKIAARGRLGSGMLVLADRNFSGHKVAAALAATGADVLIRAKSSQWLPVLQPLPDGSARSVLPDPASGHAHADARYRGRVLPGPPAGLTVRLIEADITTTPGGGPPRTGRYRLITTLLDHRAAPAAALAACYAQRWEIETSYRDMKVLIRGAGRVLRSRDPRGVAQETWALLCACQLIHAARAEAAAGGSLDPDRVSATVTLRAIRRAITSPATSPGVRAEARTLLLPPRRRRGYPRLTAAGTAKRRQARAGLTGTTTTKITISPPPAPDLPGP
ncbi:MAG: IS4 family transposase [Actinobacteria bacterium]|nr:IS4 family transposase [Actinomycetota bacterium]MBO0810365.1 IS4 family transposase [Actinomycetota bacterium]